MERGVDGGDGDDAVRRLLLGAGDHVPRHPHAVLGLELREVRHGRPLPAETIGGAGEGAGRAAGTALPFLFLESLGGILLRLVEFF